jgi:hypothetical protein
MAYTDRDKKRANEAAWQRRRRATPEGKRYTASMNLLAKYGITLEDKERMYCEREGRCDICTVLIESVSKAHVDHDHSTKHIRGLLCSHCNLMLGHARDDSDTLLAAVQYLERNSP